MDDFQGYSLKVYPYQVLDVMPSVTKTKRDCNFAIPLPLGKNRVANCYSVFLLSLVFFQEWHKLFVFQ
jgi:hypothetical protein